MSRIRPRRLVTLLLATLLPMAGCGIETSSNPPIPQIPAEVDRLADWLSGSFDNAEQAGKDAEFIDISLHACRIWPDRTDGRWLYVEQARSDAPDRPDRQRACRLRIDDLGQLISEVFAFPDGDVPDAGAWRTPAMLDRVDPFLLLPREGCTVRLEFKKGAFTGSTSGEGCPSSISGATYATSEVTIEPERIVSWDRGYDESGRQVWGATKGPYVFRRSDR